AKRRQIAIADASGDVVFEDNIVKDLAFPLIKPTGVKPERRGRQPTNPHGRFNLPQRLDGPTPHASPGVRDQMAFIREQEIAPAEPLRRAPYALDVGEDDRGVPIATL